MIKEKLAKLISVKSIITILLSFAFVYLAITNKVSAQDFNTVFIMVMTYYFTRQTNTTKNDTPKDDEVS